jgi:hypothetical protein
MDEPSKTATAPLIEQALETGQLILSPEQGPRWRSFPAAPESVAQARRFTESTLAEVIKTDVDHVDDVVLVVSELVTNAVREVAKLDLGQDGARPVHLGVDVHGRWTHLYAVDPAPALPKEAHKGPLAGSGRGIPIIKSLAALTWVELGQASKTIHVVVTRSGVELTAADRQAFSS